MFRLSPAQIAQLRTDAEKAMHDNVSFYTVDTINDLYGNEIVTSGFVGTYPAYIGGIQGREDEVIERLRAEGILKIYTAKLLVPYSAEINTTMLCVVSGGATWDVVWTNEDTTNNYQVYSKAIITRNDALTDYKDRAKRNG
jgi:hypothetical protein